MPSDEYTVVGGGALKLKGAKVDKKKKQKKKKGKPDLEKNLSTGDETAVVKKDSPPTEEDKGSGKDVANLAEEELEEEVRKTEAELRYEEYKKKRVSSISLPPVSPSRRF
jgi:protein FAM32A